MTKSVFHKFFPEIEKATKKEKSFSISDVVIRKARKRNESVLQQIKKMEKQSK